MLFNLYEQVNDMKEFNVRDWWKEHRSIFPNLFKLYLRISSNTATSTPSERAFSATSCTLDSRRSSLLPSTMNSLMVARNLYPREK